MNTNVNSRSGVIWISGYSAAGKTTVGRNVEHLLRSDGYATLFLDGDQLRSIFADKWDYSPEGRVELALIYFRLCSHLSKQGFIVIISAVAMLEEARKWFKENVDNGFEVYLKVPLEERVRRDSKTKKLYGKTAFKTDFYTESNDPDVVVENFGDVDIEEASRIIVSSFLAKAARHVDYGRTEYWSEYYKNKAAVNQPSPFAEFCLPRFNPSDKMLEIGCGNGRDSRFFAENGIRVVALDKSETAIEECKANDQMERSTYLCCQASEVGDFHAGKFDSVYSRFSLHAMTEAEEDEALVAAFDLLEQGGTFYIECRSINDPLARKGQVLSPTERLDGHYRRFIELTILEEKLTRIGFSILESTEAQGLAVFKDEDPVVIRLIANKV